MRGHRPAPPLTVLPLAAVAVLILLAGGLLFRSAPAFALQHPAAKPHAKAAVKPASLDSALAQLQSLRSRRAPRDEWAGLAASLESIAASQAATPDAAARALFAQAQVNEEMGKRFSAMRDFQNAAALYLKVADRFPNSPLADDALCNRAILALDRLGDEPTAHAALKRLVDAYPNGDKRPQAAEMLKTLEAHRPKQAKAAAPRNADKADGKAAVRQADGKSHVDEALAEIANAPKHKERGKAMRMGESAGTLLEQLGLTVQTIMVDAGHGGHDPGATAFGLKEKNIALSVAKKVGRRLEKQGFRVLYTRSTDVFIPLEKRTEMANRQKADMFVSVHLNANNKPGVSGLETYSLNLAKTHEAARVAARENAVAPRRISDLQFILTDLMLSSKVRESCDLANCVQHAVLTNARDAHELIDNGTREAPFYVLMGAKMPAVLVEVGYITNRTEAALLSSDSYQEKLAAGIVDGILAYKQKIERYASR